MRLVITLDDNDEYADAYALREEILSSEHLVPPTRLRYEGEPIVAIADAFVAGDRVFYRVSPSGTPDPRTAGTVKRVERDDDGTLIYYVLWDDVAEGHEPTEYEAGDLARCDA